ncbi:hypothetical protein EGT86_22630 [Burkholderia pseudomallei]|nr:hypothetical protein EGT86_22630 [Burkholderia pseudomallei]
MSSTKPRRRARSVTRGFAPGAACCAAHRASPWAMHARDAGSHAGIAVAARRRATRVSSASPRPPGPAGKRRHACAAS